MGSSDEDSEHKPPPRKRDKPKKSHHERWETMYQRLLAFRDKHGHCQVPNRYGADTSLGSWVSSQRRQFKGAVKSSPSWLNEMSQEKIRKLEDIGFEWAPIDPRQVPWETRYAELEQFVNDYGHAGVPRRWEPNTQLSNWVSKQRREYKKFCQGEQSSITKQRIELLQSVGFMWKACKSPAMADDSSTDEVDVLLRRPTEASSQDSAVSIPLGNNRKTFPANDTQGNATRTNTGRKRKTKVHPVESVAALASLRSFSRTLEEDVNGNFLNNKNPSTQAPLKSSKSSTMVLNRGNKGTTIEDNSSSGEEKPPFSKKRKKKQSRMQSKLERDAASESLETTDTPQSGAQAVLLSGPQIPATSSGIARSSYLGSVMLSNSGGRNNLRAQSTSSSLPGQFPQVDFMRAIHIQDSGLRSTLGTAVGSPPQVPTTRNRNPIDMVANAHLLSTQIGSPTLTGMQREDLRLRLYRQLLASRNPIVGEQLSGADEEIVSILAQERLATEQRELLLQQLSTSTQQLQLQPSSLLGQAILPPPLTGGVGLPSLLSDLYQNRGLSTGNSAELAALRNFVSLPTSTTGVRNLATSTSGLGHHGNLARVLASLQQQSQEEPRITVQAVGRQQIATGRPSPDNATADYSSSGSSTE